MFRFCCLLLLLWPLRAFAWQADTLYIRFSLGSDRLDAKAEKYIDSLIYNDIVNTGDHLMILGYADDLGTAAYNQALSKRRAQHVMAYLLQNSFDRNNIVLCIGKGAIIRQTDKATRNPPDRKVAIVRQVIRREAALPIIRADTIKTKTAITDIAKMKPNETLMLNNIFFIGGTHRFEEVSYSTLDSLYQILQNNKRLNIQIEGHVCCYSPLSYSDEDGYDIDMHIWKLSEFRAMAVYKYLVNKGIDSARMRYIGMGFKNPLVKKEITEDDKEKNRRVAIRVLKN